MMSDSNRYIVITSIFPPTEAVARFAALRGWKLIIAGDRKSPSDWRLENATFLSTADQEQSGFHLATALPWNHYCRKMIGYLHAIRQGAQVIIDTDDDNLPKPDWSFPPFDGEFPITADGEGFVNVYKLYTDRHIWPRGFPLPLITEQRAVPKRSDLRNGRARVGIWQGLADGDPDVDAIFRLTDNRPCTFDDGPPVVLGKGTLCPFNSQNTAFHRDMFPLLYLPAFVTFRFTDILRGLVAQPIMWAHGWRLGFTRATVIQERNPHNYLKDFESEIPCYLRGEEAVTIAQESVKGDRSVVENLHEVYVRLAKAGIVPDRELSLLEDWIEDITSA